MQVPVFTVDAFTNRPFCGNPAVVCLLENVSLKKKRRELAIIIYFKFLCLILLQCSLSLENPNSVLTFVTLSGELKTRQEKDQIVLDLPLYSTYPQVPQEVEELIKAATGDMIVQDLRYSPDTEKLLVRLSDAYERSVLEELQVRAQHFLSAEKTGKVKGLILTLKGKSNGKDKGHDFYSRYFAPWYGVLEDPVTGVSSHTLLSLFYICGASAEISSSLRTLYCGCSQPYKEYELS
uniref:Phenazine biosynthesis-like domain-containing protein n=1 Tax=Pavo cristatus TaxID=9049 RepID=A0A8C9L1Z0_PAVCR